jgi:hypothetical protein
MEPRLIDSLYKAGIEDIDLKSNLDKKSQKREAFTNYKLSRHIKNFHVGLSSHAESIER